MTNAVSLPFIVCWLLLSSLIIKMDTGSFPGVMCGRSVLLTTHSLPVPRSWKTHPLGHTGPVTGSLYLYTTFNLYNIAWLFVRLKLSVTDRMVLDNRCGSGYVGAKCWYFHVHVWFPPPHTHLGTCSFTCTLLQFSRIISLEKFAQRPCFNSGDSAMLPSLLVQSFGRSAGTFHPMCVKHTNTHTYRPFDTRVSQLKIQHFWVIGMERNVCRCTFNRYSVITEFA